jgi:L-histidine Nalpha-methyltransferase
VTVLAPGRVTVDVRLAPDDLDAALRRDALAGLSATPKTMPPVWFYDDRGCALYEAITRTPEYYPFRAERELLRDVAGEVAEAAAATVLVELGSGTSEKTRLLLDAMAGADAGLAGYVPFDVAETTLRSAARAVADDYGIGVHAVVGDFRTHLGHLAGVPDGNAPRLVAFLGSTIGNFTPRQRVGFLEDVAALLRPAGRLLLATDLVKPVDRLMAAYDDAAGVTAAFNRNLLDVLNRELGADFDVGRFDHVVEWDPVHQRVEMRLRATRPMTVKLPEIGLVVDFDTGEDLRTEVSTKFTPDGVRRDLAAVGLAVLGQWEDGAGDYLLTLAGPA